MISEPQVLDNLIELVLALPELQAAVPAGADTRAFWRRQFRSHAEAQRLLQILREMPAFNARAPRRRTAAAWRAVFDDGCGGSALEVLRQVLTSAKRQRLRRPPLRRWRDAYGPDERIQRVRPVESDAWLPNPHRGTATFQRFQGDPLYAALLWNDTCGPVEFPSAKKVVDNEQYIPRTTLSYCRWPWAWLEPKKGQYRWDIVDGALRRARACGQTLQLRFQPYTEPVDYSRTPCTAKRHPPRRSVNVPDWYWETGARYIRKGQHGENEPDCNDRHYILQFGRFVRAFAKRYDGHPDLESVDIAYAGFWGESGGNTTPATAAKLVDIYLKSFRKTQLVSMLGPAGCRHAQRRTAGTLRPVGWRADSFGDFHVTDVPQIPYGRGWNHMFDNYPKEIAQCGVGEVWKTAPVTMETSANVPHWFFHGLDLDQILRAGYGYHMSVFMPKSAFFPAAWREKLEAFDRKIGYRFALRQMLLPLACRRGERFLIECCVDNVGCAPIYRPYRLALRFRQGKRRWIVPLQPDIRGWLPGESWFDERVTLPAGLARGEAQLDIGIIGGDNQPHVWFAIEGEPVDGWHSLTSIDVA